jgi:hypothetical protein
MATVTKLIPLTKASTDQLLTAANFAGFQWDNYIEDEERLTTIEKNFIIKNLKRLGFSFITSSNGFTKPV